MQIETKFQRELEYVKSLSTEDELKDHRTQLMLERAAIEADLANPDITREAIEDWKARAKFSFRTKGILISEVDRKLSSFKTKLLDESFLACFLKVAMIELVGETFDNIYEEAQRLHKKVNKEVS